MRQEQLRFTRVFWIALAGGLLVLAFVLPVPAAQAQDDRPCGDSYTIQEGDTLIGIASQCNTTVNALQQANPDINARTLTVGATLVIPPEATEDPAAEPSLAIVPTIGGPGTQIHVLANNLSANADVEIGIGRPNSEYDVIAQTVSDGYGTVSQYITVPEFMGNDPWVVVVSEPASGLEIVSSTELARVAIAPTQGPPGSTVQVIANGFPANTEIDIGVGPWRSEYTVQQRVTSNDAGTIQAAVAMPAIAAAGDRYVVVATGPQNIPTAQSALFHVTPATDVPTAVPATQTPPPAMTPTATVMPGMTSTPPATEAQQVFERVNIALIALDDGGESGPALACNDSAVLVEVPVEPTTVPLVAALQTLLLVEDEFYGQSGLYNALHASELALASAEIVDGHAEIRVTGILRESRLCDMQRIKAQIMQTALQYDSVNTVTVYLNGTMF